MNDATTKELLSEFQRDLLTLNYTGLVSVLDTIDKYGTDNIAQMFFKKISDLVLPIFYPSDNDSSLLRFNMQCKTCVYLAKWSPSSRTKILSSLISLYDKYKKNFKEKSFLNQMFESLVSNSVDYWDMFNHEVVFYSLETQWDFLIFSALNDNLKNKSNWDFLIKLVSTENGIKKGEYSKMFSFFEKLTFIWERNENFSLALMNYLNDIDQNEFFSIPEFIFDKNIRPNKVSEFFIYVTCINLSEKTSSIARTLSLITQSEKRMKNNIFKISFFSFLLLNIPCFHKNIINRLLSLVSYPDTPARVAAQVSTIICPFEDNFDVIDRVTRSLNENDIKDSSRFFSFLSYQKELLHNKNIIKFLDDLFISIKNGKYIYGVLKFIHEILSIHKDSLSEQNDKVASFIDVMKHVTPANFTNKLSKIAARLLDIIIDGTILDIDTFSIKSIEYTVGVCAYSLKFSGATLYSEEHVCTCIFICDICDFAKLRDILLTNLTIYFGSKAFPPDNLVLSHELCSHITNSVREALLWKDKTVVYQSLAKALYFFEDDLQVRSVVNDYFNKDNIEFFTSEFILSLLNTLEHRGIDKNCIRTPLFKMLCCPKGSWNQTFRLILENEMFRRWLLRDVLCIAAIKRVSPFIILENFQMTQEEFSLLLPAIKQWLQYPSVHEMRAAIMNFVSMNFDKNKTLYEYNVKLASSILLNSEAPSFPNIHIPSIHMHITDISLQENKLGALKELDAILSVLARAVDTDSVYLDDNQLEQIHKKFKHSKDRRILDSYTSFLKSLSFRGYTLLDSIYPLNILKRY